MKLPNNLFSASLCLPDNAMAFRIAREIREAAPDLAVMETHDYDFNPIAFADSGGCEVVLRDDAYGHWSASWYDDNVEMRPQSAAVDVHWRGEIFTLVTVKLGECGRIWYIVGKDIVSCERFFAAVCHWNTDARGVIMVFEHGFFHRDEGLREEIRERKLADLTLPDETRPLLQADVLDFFSQEEWYRSMGIPWKRGIILHGPPGNGKTQTIRAIVNELNVATIYVRSLSGHRVSPEQALQRIFHRARQNAPCVVVMEDVDSLIRETYRSFFLNELDGIRNLHGVMTIVSTNHLERLDVAIRDRPNRFDVKIEFPNPNAQLRAEYLVEPLYLRKLDRQFAGTVLRRTRGLSFAGLQEVVRSTTARHMRVMDLRVAIDQTLESMGRPVAVPEKKVKKSKKKSGSK